MAVYINPPHVDMAIEKKNGSLSSGSGQITRSEELAALKPEPHSKYPVDFVFGVSSQPSTRKGWRICHDVSSFFFSLFNTQKQ